VFRSPGHPAEEVIGGIPLFMRAVFAALGLYLLQQRLPTRRKLIFYAVYLFVLVNLSELVAYILMRPFAGSGYTGRFNEGLMLSPPPLFVVGTVLSARFWSASTQVFGHVHGGYGRENGPHGISFVNCAILARIGEDQLGLRQPIILELDSRPGWK
jgi:hypothetical protein